MSARPTLILAVVFLLVAVAPSAAAAASQRGRPVRVRTVRVERPSGFSVRDALVGVAFTGACLGAVGLVAARRTRGSGPEP